MYICITWQVIQVQVPEGGFEDASAMIIIISSINIIVIIIQFIISSMITLLLLVSWLLMLFHFEGAIICAATPQGRQIDVVVPAGFPVGSIMNVSVPIYTI